MLRRVRRGLFSLAESDFEGRVLMRSVWIWCALVAVHLCVSSAGAEEKTVSRERWQQILGPSVGEIPGDPDPGGEVVWRKEFESALREATITGRPLLVTWRCLPCEQCAEFDKEILDGSPRLDPLLRRFVTVRLTDASKLDERYFPYRTHQDLDLSWWAYFLSSEGNLYSVFGGKDHVSENTRISEAAFINVLQRVLAHHYDPRRSDWNVDLPVGAASKTKSGPMETRGYELLLAKRPGIAKPHREYGSCIHCHQVGDMLTLEAIDAGTFKVEQLIEKWPFPENVGILLDRDDGLRVAKVERGGPAEAIGLRVGDRLAMANGTRLFGQADFRGVLHRAAFGQDSIDIAWLRGDDVHFGTLHVEAGWRASKHSWRKTVYDGVYGPGMGFFPLKGPQAGKGKGLSIKPWMGPKPSDRPVFATGLRPHMEIIAIDGMDEDLETRELISWFRLNHKPGDRVTYTVRGGKKFRFVLPQDE